MPDFDHISKDSPFKFLEIINDHEFDKFVRMSILIDFRTTLLNSKIAQIKMLKRMII